MTKDKVNLSKKTPEQPKNQPENQPEKKDRTEIQKLVDELEQEEIVKYYLSDEEDVIPPIDCSAFNFQCAVFERKDYQEIEKNVRKFQSLLVQKKLYNNTDSATGAVNFLKIYSEKKSNKDPIPFSEQEIKDHTDKIIKYMQLNNGKSQS